MCVCAHVHVCMCILACVCVYERRNFDPFFYLAGQLMIRHGVESFGHVSSAVERTRKGPAGRTPLVTGADKNGISLSCVCMRVCAPLWKVRLYTVAVLLYLFALYLY